MVWSGGSVLPSRYRPRWAHFTFPFPDEHEHVGFTALAGLALLTPGPEGEGPARQDALDRAAAWLIDVAGRNEYGYFTASDTRLMEHAYATLFIAEMQIRNPAERQEVMLRRAVDLLVHSQGEEGGWGYQPVPRDSDVINTVPVLEALRAAARADVDVPENTWDRAIDFLGRCGKEGLSGSFRYRDRRDSRTSYACTAAGLYALLESGRANDAPYIRDGMVYLKDHYGESKLEDYNFLFGRFYALHAMTHSFQEWRDDLARQLRHDLIRSQSADGGWSDDVGPVYATAMACLILQECR